jgi:hypothetical protein
MLAIPHLVQSHLEPGPPPLGGYGERGACRAGVRDADERRHVLRLGHTHPWAKAIPPSTLWAATLARSGPTKTRRSRTAFAATAPTRSSRVCSRLCSRRPRSSTTTAARAVRWQRPYAVREPRAVSRGVCSPGVGRRHDPLSAQVGSRPEPGRAEPATAHHPPLIATLLGRVEVSGLRVAGAAIDLCFERTGQHVTLADARIDGDVEVGLEIAGDRRSFEDV